MPPMASVVIYASIQKHEQLQKLSKKDQEEIVAVFNDIDPLPDDEMEMSYIDFRIDPEAPIPSPIRKPIRLKDIDYNYILEQVSKCDNKIIEADFEGAITNARNLLESICKYILDDANETYENKADLPNLYKKTSILLNMHPSEHAEKSFKQILSGCSNIIHGIAAVRNELSDAHGKSRNKNYKPDERHAMLAVGVSKAMADFMFASYVDNKKKHLTK